MKTNDYWKNRVITDEEKTQRIAATYGRRQKKYYKQMIAAIDTQIDFLYAKTLNREYISRSELWQLQHYQALRQEINKQCEGLAIEQLSLTQQALEKVTETVLGTEWKENEATRILSQAQVKQYINENWSGESYSNRIYHNCNQLAVKLQDEIGEMVVLGKAPEMVKAAVMEECGVSYNVANRLIRTEASYTFNQASLKRYEDMGAKKVEVFTEPDACEECLALGGQEFEFFNAPLIPQHPFAVAVTYQFWKIRVSNR